MTRIVPMVLWLHRLALVACLVLVSSCAGVPRQTRYISSVDALAAPTASTLRHYALLPADPSTNSSDLQFREFAGYVERALDRRGFVKATNLWEAEVAIFLDYAIGEPKAHRYAYIMPTFGTTGVASSTTQGTFSSSGNSGTYSATTTYAPAYGVTGYATREGSYTTSTRFLMLHAYDVAAYKKDQTMSEVWTTTVVSTGSSSDLRRVFPYMVAAMLPYMGKDSAKRVQVVLPENSSVVAALRGDGSPQPGQ